MRPFASGKQRGFSLIVALMMLIVIIILGVSAAQMAINEERGARNDRDRQVAFQAAEAALKDGEWEILDLAAPACAAAPFQGRGRNNGSFTCFTESSGLGFVVNCSASPNEGLCLSADVNSPAYLSSNVNFLADAQGTGNNNTVQYGRFSGRTFPTRATAGYNSLPVPRYPPRYIIERVPKNVSYDTATEGSKYMFRVTAMGFGANENSQVVLQSVVSTLD